LRPPRHRGGNGDPGTHRRPVDRRTGDHRADEGPWRRTDPASKNAKGDKLATGDAVFTRLAMSSPDGAALGSAYTECTNVGAKAGAINATPQCVQTYRFKNGQIVTAGVVKFSQLENLSIPIVGGSGAYRGASGVVSTGKPVKGFDSVDVLRLDS
jgi:hypothetical protein